MVTGPVADAAPLVVLRATLRPMGRQEGAVVVNRALAILGVACIGVAALGVVGRVWWAAARGFDLTDEGMYVNWLTHASDWPWASTQFAFVFGPLWSAAGQDLVLTRRLTVLLLCAFVAAFLTVTTRRALRLPRSNALMWGLLLSPVGCLGVGSPTLFAIPNYNLLGLLGILVAATSLILLLMPWENDDELAPWVLLGVAEMLCFASRPTAGALLLVVCLVAIPVAGRWSYRGACMALLSVLVCFLGLAQAVDGHPVRFLARVIEGLNLYQLQTRRTLFDAIASTWTTGTSWYEGDQRVALSLGGALLISLLAARRSTSGSRPELVTRVLAVVVTGLSAMAALVALLTFTSVLSSALSRMVTLALVLTGVACLMWLSRLRLPHGRNVIVAAATVGTLPFVYAFSTYNSTIALMGTASVCWLGTSIVLLGPSSTSLDVLLPVSGVWLLTTAICLTASMESPPRQADLRDATASVRLASRGTVLLAPELASYLSALEAGMNAEGFLPGTPILDLTGESPGVVYHVRGQATADPWVIGGYVGSRDRLERQLRLHTDCLTLGQSWLIVSPDGKRRIDVEILSIFGLDFPSGYRQIVERKAPETSGGYRAQIWAPIAPSVQAAACSAQRK